LEKLLPFKARETSPLARFIYDTAWTPLWGA
jgi:hypothetical protein